MDLYEIFIKPYESYENSQVILEAIATIFGLLSVYFSIRKNIWVYPTGIISTAISVYLLFIGNLLGDMMVNVYYTIMSIYGWFLWSKSSNTQQVEVVETTRKEWLVSIFVFMFSVVLISIIYYYKPLIDNKFVSDGITLSLSNLDWVNWVDVFVASVFFVGMWLMAKRKIENWIFWIVGDFISVPLYLKKGMLFTSFQYLLFTIIAIMGYIEWKRHLRNTPVPSQK